MKAIVIHAARDLRVEEREHEAPGAGQIEIAIEAGFADCAHFSRQFKDAYGLSPSTRRLQPQRISGGDAFERGLTTHSRWDDYLAALSKQGKPTADVKFAAGYNWLICSNDPDKTFNEAADHIIYQADNYLAWSEKAGQTPNPTYLRNREGLRKSGYFQVVDPETAIKMIREYISAVPVTHYYSWTLPPGLPPRWAQPHLELFASKVIPALNGVGR